MAIVVLSIVLVAIAPMFYHSRGFIYQAGLKRQAMVVATRELERELSKPFDRLSDRKKQVDLEQVTATVRVDVVDTQVDPDGDGYRRVTVTVDWSHGGREQDVSLTTLVASAGGAS